MECNKAEAARVKALAERKLLDKDFVGAKKLIIKAQQLSKEVGDIDIPKMLTVCDVHCAAGAKENVQIDWYGILQVPETADDTQIKKQYHKLALLLHPDKNKFGGAEAAFKLVGEANKTLTDRLKRSLYDMERVRATQTTFWTVCPSCGTRYQYYISVLKKVLCCQTCSKRFIAHDLKEQAVPYGAKQHSARAVVESSESSISETSSDSEEERAVAEPSEPSISETSSDSEEEGAVVESSGSSISETSSDSEEEIAGHGPAANGSAQAQRSRQLQEFKYNEENVDDDFVNSPILKRLRKSGMFCGDDNKKTTKLVEEIAGHNDMTDGANNCSTTEDEREGGSSMHGLDLDTDDASDVVPQGDTLRFSHCVPHHVVSGTEKEGIPEKSLELDPAMLSLDLEEDFPSIAQVVSIMHGSAVHDLMEQVVPSGVNQQYAEVWKNAGVPQKSPGPQTNLTAQKAWSATPGLDANVASHHAGENTKRETAANTIGPQDKMKSDHAARNPSKALSTAGLKRGRRAVVEFSESSTSETSSGCEEKVAEHGPAANGSGLGQQTRRSSWQKQEVRYNEEIDDDDDVLNNKIDDFVNSRGLKRLRKSLMFHGDHSNKATNLNKEIAGHNGLTNGVNIRSNTQKKKVSAHAPCGEKSFNKIQQMERETMHCGENGNGNKKEFHSGRSNGLRLNNDDASHEYKFTSVDPKFFDFGQLRDENEFRTNQIWAVCDDQGCMPRFYAQITNVKTMPNFMLHFVWLELYPTNKVESAWSFSGLPVSCGRFKYGKSDTAKEIGMFSRTISFEKSKTRNCFEIYPREGEVWALFKGWDIGWRSDPDNHKYCSLQYEVVQVLSDLTMSTSINVMPLVKIKGYGNLFMQSREAAPYVIPQGDTLRFSHCIPHHVISAIGERVPEGSLELDPAALPIDLEEVFPSVIPECSSERSHGCDAKFAGSSSGNSSRKGFLSVGKGQYTTSMNEGIAAKTPKEVNSQNNRATASDDNKFIFPVPEFFNFDQLRDENQFGANQIWAVYDDQGCMPRFYARITEVKTSPDFMLHFVWLEFDPTNKVEAAWSFGGLPVACGCFEHGQSDTAKETGRFSRIISFEKSKTRNCYEIYPREGEVWALFKGWDIGWSSDADNHKHSSYQYELVQVLSDLTTSSAIIAMPLVKIKGFVSLFMLSREADAYVIPEGDTLRFSHCVPHHLMSGNEKGVPKGSVELDPAALPIYMVETFLCETLECSSISQNNGDKYAGSAETPNEENSKHNTCSAEVTDVVEDSICHCQTIHVHAESEFYDFSQRRLLQKFSPGNIWALYSDIDNFPNYYGFIQKVDLKNGEVQVRWLDVCPRGEEEKILLQEKRTIGCGTFRLSSVHKLMTYNDTNVFSHCVEARSNGQEGEYEIIPHLGEIWAVYKNWRAGWTAQDFGRCEYELVEVLGHTGSSIRVQLLRKVDGYRMVFMPYKAEGSVKTIRKDEYPKFSHQIPCFRLTCEEGGKLRGCLELNPLSLPEEFLNVR